MHSIGGMVNPNSKGNDMKEYHGGKQYTLTFNVYEITLWAKNTWQVWAQEVTTGETCELWLTTAMAEALELFADFTFEVIYQESVIGYWRCDDTDYHRFNTPSLTNMPSVDEVWGN